MQTACWEMPWLRALRAVALMLAVVLGLEWTVPLGGYAQPNQDPASAPAATVGKQDLPPIQEAEAGEEDRPIYKKFMVSPLALPRIVLLFQKRSPLQLDCANAKGSFRYHLYVARTPT